MIRDAIDQVAPNARAKGLALTFEENSSSPAVSTNPRRLMEILINLIGNAIKYTPKGEVVVSTAFKGEMVRVSIQDLGLGMSAEAQKHLFEKFYRIQTPETISIQGTGLGLYVTKSMIEKAGGSIAVESTPGLGSTFSFTIPLDPH